MTTQKELWAAHEEASIKLTHMFYARDYDAFNEYRHVAIELFEQLDNPFEVGDTVDGKSIKLGYFQSEIHAALAYNEAAKKYHGDYAVLNEVEKMDINEYQQKASRTIPEEKWFNTKLANFSMGLAGETGEVIDHFKKHLYHGHELNLEEVKKELGDVLWYVSSIATILNVDMSEIALKNIEKLENRYPEGFCEKDSVERKE